MPKTTNPLGLSPLSVAFATVIFILSSGCGGGTSSTPGRWSGSTLPTDLSGLSSQFTFPPPDANGWSILTPSADSRLIYVSTIGNDTTGTYYSLSSVEVGTDPYNPSGGILSFATITAALAQARAGYPDYILLRRGDTWTAAGNINLKAGRSVAERSVFGYYGSNPARPVILHYGVNLGRASYSAVIGIQFTASQRNPNSADFVGFDNVARDYGFDALGGYNNTVVGGLLIEDCWFDWFSGNIIQSPQTTAPVLTDVIIRRNIITNNYSTSSHSQGLYSDRASVWLEENIFDHNGWYKQGVGNVQAEGQATMFNHNTYFGAARDTVFRNNLFLRASSIGSKFTSNTGSGMNEEKAWNLLIDNNLYIEGEVGISLGGNDDQDNGPRWRNIHVTNNVMMHIGRAQPTSRTLGWGLDVDDWDGGIVSGNIFTNWGDAVLNNNFAIVAAGDANDVSYTNNVIYNIYSGSALVQFRDPAYHKRVRFSNNDIQANSATPLLSYSLDGNAGFSDNYFYSTRSQAQWFLVSGATTSIGAYRTASGDTTSTAGQRSYVAPERTIETYLASRGSATDMNSFVAQLVQQSKFNWIPALGAAAINDYIRAGFATN